MTNPFYNHSTYPLTGSAGASSSMRAELDAITAGFALMPNLVGNSLKLWRVNLAESAVEAVTLSGAIAADLIPPGAYSLGASGSEWVNLWLSGTATINGNIVTNGNVSFGNSSGDTFGVNAAACSWPNNPTHSGNHTFTNNVTFNGNTTIGNAAGDALTVTPSAVTWSNNPTHSGLHTFSSLLALAAGLQLQNTDLASATTLDWYEEGTFTPSVAFSGASVGVTYAAQRYGVFTRIGNWVFFQLQVTLTSKGSSAGNLQITGMPYSMASAPSPVFSVIASAMSALALPSYALRTSATVIALSHDAGAGSGATTSLLDTNCTNTTNILISGHYKVA